MKQTPSRVAHPVNTMANPVVSAASVLLLLSVLGVVLFVAVRSPLKDDIAWLLYVARRWMAGKELYTDLIEVNPPLIIWISAIPIAVADWLRVDAQFVAMPFFIAAILACNWWSASLLRANGGLFANRLPVFALIGSVFLVVPAGDLGQREHLLAAATLPYLILFARRLDGERLPVAASLAAGILAGLGCALKPRYGAVFAVLECVALAYGLRPWRLMPVAAVTTMIGYAGLVDAVSPAYLRQAIPMALALYGATDVSFLHLLSDSAVLIAEEVVAFGLLWLRRRGMAEYKLMLTLMVFAATSTVLCFVAGKDWYYHRLPATIITVLALILWGVSEAVRQGRSIRLPLLVGTAAVAVFCFRSVQRMEPAVAEAVAPQHTIEARLEHLIRLEHAHTYVAFSEWLALGFPVVNETGVRWASRFDSMWALKGEVWRAGFDPTTRKDWPIARWVANDFIAGCPDLAVVDTRETTNYIKVLSASDPAFVRVWSHYHPITAFGGLTVYRRGKGACLTVTVAAAGTGVKHLR
jgi:hypothetical protein